MNGRSKIKMAVLGGGPREKDLLKDFVDLGLELVFYGSPPFSIEGIVVVDSLESLLKGASILFVPSSGFDDDGRLREPFDESLIFKEDFFSVVEKGAILFLGYAKNPLKKRLQEESISYIEYLHHEEVATLNAIPTAEGAIQLALEGLSTTIHGTKTLVLGLGRVGLALSRRLMALHASIIGVNRSKEGLFKGVEMGLSVIPLEEMESYLGDVDLLFNTIPALVLDSHRLHLIRREALLFDLASAPGGIDFKRARDLHLKASLCPGLPGRLFPERGASILRETLPSIIEREVIHRGGDMDGG